MAEEKNIKSEATKVTNPTSPFSKLSALSLIVSAVSLGLAGFVFINSENEAKNISKTNQTYTTMQSEIDKLKENQSQQKGILDEVSMQSDAQKEGVKVLQAQLDTLNAQVATPTRDIYLQMSVANIQSALDYLILAKDVALFSGDTAKAEDLAETAFDRIEASRIANIGASKRKDIKKALESYVSRNDVAKEFAGIQQQFSGLTYITPANFDKPKTKQNKYWKYLSSVVEIQDISKDHQLVATKLSKQFIADNLYSSLIDLQTAMYMDNEKAIEQSKASLLHIINEYFVQNDKTQALEKSLEAIEPQRTANLTNSIDIVISDLNKQQNSLIACNSKAKDVKEQVSSKQYVSNLSKNVTKEEV